MKKQNKNLTIGVILLSLIFITMVISLMVWQEQSRLTEIYTYKNDVEFVNLYMQRLINIIDNEDYLFKDILYLSEYSNRVFIFEDEKPFYINNQTQICIDELIAHTKKIELSHDTITNTDLMLLRDSYFKTGVDLSSLLIHEVSLIQDNINQYQAIIFTLLVSMVVTMLNFPFKGNVKLNEDFIFED